MPPLPLAPPSLQRRLHLGDADDNAAADLRDNLSGLAAGDGWLWLAGDEGRSLQRLQADASGGYGHSSRVKLADFGLAGGKAEGESDLEGLALNGDRLWLVGSHSLRRRRHDSDKGEPLALDPQRSANAQVLGCLHLDGRGVPRSGQRLRCTTTNSVDALTAALASEPLLRPFLPIPSKDNGLDIEGIAARGDRVLHPPRWLSAAGGTGLMAAALLQLQQHLPAMVGFALLLQPFLAPTNQLRLSQP